MKRTAALLFLLFLFLCGCGGPAPAPGNPVRTAAPVSCPGPIAEGVKVFCFRFSEQGGCPALLVLNPSAAPAVIVNGVPVGSQDPERNGFVERADYTALVRIPPGLLRPGTDNVAQIRFPGPHGGRQTGPPRVYAGDCRDLSLLRRDRAYRSTILEIVLLTTFAFFLIASFALFLSGMRQGEYAAFTVLIALYLALFFLDSRLFYATGAKTPGVQALVYSLFMLISAVIVWFVFAANKEPMNRTAKSLVALCGLLALTMGFVRSRATYLALEPACLTVFAVSMALAFFRTARAFKRRLPESGFVLMGFVGLAASLILMATGLVDPIEWNDYKILDFGFVFFLISIEWGLMSRFARTYRGWRRLSRQILEAEQQERVRLSRDIHDGIGQSLVGVKLKLQLLAADQGGALARSLAPAVEEMTRMGGELRQMVTELRPAFVEEMTLDRLLAWLAERMEKQTDVVVFLTAETDLDLPVQAKDNLFRLCQEALANAAKHSGADEIHVTLSRQGRRLRLAVRDNGRGFDALAAYGRGTGLMSMEERAELLGGRLTLRSEPGKGTTLIVEVPVP